MDNFLGKFMKPDARRNLKNLNKPIIIEDKEKYVNYSSKRNKKNSQETFTSLK
jgi:hypothetical protein